MGRGKWEEVDMKDILWKEMVLKEEVVRRGNVGKQEIRAEQGVKINKKTKEVKM